jgi:hypothetical protein
MAIPEAVVTYLRGIADSAQVADHPQVETLYAMALSTINVTPWGSNSSLALALVTAHYCLKYPASEAHLDRTPIESVQGAQSPTKYQPIAVDARDSSFRETVPGRQYLDLRLRLLGSITPKVL